MATPFWISIHTPTQGVTIGLGYFLFLCIISIHTPTQGVTSNNFCHFIIRTISIHTPTQGVTLRFLLTFFKFSYFNPHSHAGSDTGTPGTATPGTDFNPHSHAGSDPDDGSKNAESKISIHTPTQGVTGVQTEDEET